MQDYGVVFAGRLCEGVAPEEARANLARLLRIDDAARLDRLFSGKPVVIKKGLDATQARRYEQALRQAGVICELRRAAPAPAAAPPPAPAPAPVAAAAVPARPALSLEPLAQAPVEETPPPARSALSLEPLALAPVDDAPAPAASAPSRPAPAAPAAPRAVAATAATSAAAEAPAVTGIVIKGSGSGYGDSSITPDEVKGLCWGGFFLPWIWGGFNGVGITFLALPGMGILRRVLPRSVLVGVSLLLSLFMLVKGRELAWQNKTWESVEHFNRVQRRWTQAGLAFALVMMVIIPSCIAKEQRAERELAAELARLEAEAKAEEAAAAAEADPYAGETGDFSGGESSPFAGEGADGGSPASF